MKQIKPKKNHCTGCTDKNSEGTHQMGTIEHPEPQTYKEKPMDPQTKKEPEKICGTKENPCPCGWTFPHIPLGTTSPSVKLEVKPQTKKCGVEVELRPNGERLICANELPCPCHTPEKNDWEKEMRDKYNNGYFYSTSLLIDYVRQLLIKEEIKWRKIIKDNWENPPMGVSQWRNHGEKYGYDKFFETRFKEELKKKVEGLKYKDGFINNLTIHYNSAIGEVLKLL